MTAEQRAVVDMPIRTGSFVEAAPGSGKTRLIVARFLRRATEMRGVRGVAVLSYTNIAAGEIRSRCHEAGLGDLCQSPHFVGTIDSFVAQFLIVPFGSPWFKGRPRIIDAWSRFGIEIRPKGFRGPFGLPLDRFTVRDDLDIDLDPERVPRQLRAMVQQDPEKWLEEARRRRQRLLDRGLMSCADARMCAAKRIRDPRGKPILRALAARFAELIVDEAQDCNAEDVALLQWLRAAGVPLLVVCDPDQAIFEFRGGDRNALVSLISGLERTSLTGNFRSTQLICDFAATLRGRGPDTAAGCLAATSIVPAVLRYRQRNPELLGTFYATLLDKHGIKRSNAVVLAHGRRTAERVAGVIDVKESESSAATIGRASVAFRSAFPADRLLAVDTVGRVILRRLDLEDEDEESGRIAERNGIPPRWLRETSSALLGAIRPPSGDVSSWIARTQALIEAVAPPPEINWKRSAKQVVPNRPFEIEEAMNTERLRALTIHQAKGAQFDAVLVVIPPHAVHSDTNALIDAWKRGIDLEAKRVVYVGVTRAKRFVGVGVPDDVADEVLGILNGHSVAFDSHDCAGSVNDGIGDRIAR